jgi:2-dehydropantoate 2-reductase
MRRDLQAVREHGLRIRSPDGDFHIRAAVFGDPREIGPVDLVICALKATSLDVAEQLIRPCLDARTRILVLMNGLGVEEQFAGWFEPQRIFGGLAFVCINRGEPGVILHSDYGRVMIGSLGGDRDGSAAIADLFAGAGFEATVPASLKQARWQKLMWNIPFSTLAISAGAVTTREIMDDAGLRLLATRLITERGAAGNADGCSLDVPAILARMVHDTDTMGAYRPSMLVDYQNRQPLEVEAILGEPVRRAGRLGVPVPIMEAQYRLVSFLDRLNRGEVIRGS